MRLLVVEDHQSLGRYLANGLREEAFAVDLSFDGNEALALAAANPYDGMILDMMLPGKDGWAIIAALRERGSNVPILCLTARDALGDRVRGLNLGADDYLAKPFEWDELLARINALIRRRHGVRSPIIRIVDLEIDTTRKNARRAGQPIQLSEREFVLLEYLARRTGEVVSRDEIWAHLWDQHDSSNSNMVDVYIGHLRKKIDAEHDIKLIHTRRRLGYLLGGSPEEVPPGGEA